MNKVIATATKHWQYIAPLVCYPTNKQAYEKLVSRLDDLLDIIGDDENHALIGLVDVISTLIAAYEHDHHPKPKNSGVAALKHLMEAHNFNQSDLLEIGSQGVISEILNGKRMLNLRQIKLLAKRFHVNPATFIDDIEN